MKLWWRVLVPAAVFAIAIAAVVAVQAVGDDGTGEPRDAAVHEQDAPGDGSGVAAACLEGATDCADTVGGPEGGGSGETRLADCPVDTACIEPWLMDPPTCPEGIDPEECRKLIAPLPRCVIEDIEPQILPVEPDAGTGASDAPLPANGGEETADADPGPDDVAPPIGECEPAPCLGDAVTTCLPPDCAVSSDGVVSCPEPLPAPDGAGTSGNPGQTEPGSAPPSDPGIDAEIDAQEAAE